ncbi:MAG: hypothetical protein LBB75_09655 [Oscillospiraceae bacterium]|nr:hypothetical protein [Oscillospiraceae bacterium]
MKKIFALALVLALALSLSACAGGEKESGGISPPLGGGNENSGPQAGDIRTENWRDIVRQVFGMDISLPGGWAVKEAASPNGLTNVDIVFVSNGAVPAADFAATIFDASKAASQKSIASASDANAAYDSFAAAAKTGAEVISWRYFPRGESDAGHVVNLRYSDNELLLNMR